MIRKTNKNKPKMPKGGRNLVVLGIVATIIAIATTGISLLIYHNSGDIYLDRSRPGFLPDEKELEQEVENEKEDYNFEKTGKLTAGIIEEYLEKLNIEIEAIDSYKNPFDENALSDERLGIPETNTK